ncbi:hypothetical protein KSP39_PZI016460 [Platanthera zijinensis]|uniref:Uncharacterized protein n=1 Tax=Platanthera zijinensis TaxID=2320716 RepID=A0AAP0B733_9ASPA
MAGIGRMPFALETGEGIGGSRLIRGVAFFPASEPPPVVTAPSVSHSSSVGRNSDCCSTGGDDGGEAEVQSPYKGPLENMDSLAESLPIRSGLSKFYCGKSRSFVVLSDAITKLSSAKELGKPRNSYCRKRKPLLGMAGWWETADGCRSSGVGASKRHAIAGSPFSASDTGSTAAGLCLPARSFSVMNLEGIEGLSSASSPFSSLGSGREGLCS